MTLTQVGRVFFFAVALSGGFALSFPLETHGADGMSLDKLGDCNWQVSYRGRIYDLSPLTRESLSRPIENDIRFAIQRVPEANARLEAMTGHLRDAKAHTMLASLFISGLLVTKLLEGRVKNDADRGDYRAVEAAAGGFFLTATLFSWRSSVRAKQELVNAVDEFNAHSPYKIEPSMGSSRAEK